MGPIFSSSSNSSEMSCANLLRLGGVLISKVVANGLVDRWNKEELRKGSSSRMAVGDRIIALNGEELKGDELLERLKMLSSVKGWWVGEDRFGQPVIWAKVGATCATWEKQDARQNPKGGHVEGNLSPP